MEEAALAEAEAEGSDGSVDAMVDRAVSAGDAERAMRESAADARLAGARERFDAPDVVPSDEEVE